MTIRIGATYRHSKRGTCYLVQTVGKLERTGEEHVVYRALTDGTVWVRPLREWDELVQLHDRVVPRTAPRFELVDGRKDGLDP